jgi:hypothetical protein
MRVTRLIITFILFSLYSAAQKPTLNDWVNRLNDESKQQVIKHYTVYYDITKLEIKQAFVFVNWNAITIQSVNFK